MALGSPAILRATMQHEQAKFATEAFDADAIRPVFICGLARSGSTLLLNSLAATGAFSTSTYRHMPFVLAPNTWGSASRTNRLKSEATERAHGDGMAHSFDSEEAFEEVFWRAVNGNATGATLPWNHEADHETIRAFRRFMQSVTRAGSAPRYLSKNNTNLTRIPALLKSVPTAHVVIPFRDPLGFVGSTLAQHKRFLARGNEDRFAASYMGWLGHHEFGPGFKPFAAPGVSPPVNIETGVTADYLAGYWIAVSRTLLDLDPARVTLFDYDAFCSAPAERMAALGRAIELARTPAPPANVHPPRPYDGLEISQLRLRQARDLHGELAARARLGHDRDLQRQAN